MSEYGFRYTQDYLNHSGVIGQKWHRRRYQNKDGSLTEEGRIHYGVGKSREQAAKEKLKKQREEEKESAKQEKKAVKEQKVADKQLAKSEKKYDAINKKKEKEEKSSKKDAKKISPIDYSTLTEEQRNALKEKAIHEGNAKEAAANVKYFSNQEINDIEKRIESIAKIKKLSTKDVKTGKQVVEDLINKMDTAGKLMEKGVNIWKQTTRIKNLIEGRGPDDYGKQDKKDDKKDDGGGLVEALTKAVSTNNNNNNSNNNNNNNKNQNNKNQNNKNQKGKKGNK